MGALSSYDMRAILADLDGALAETMVADLVIGARMAAWHIRRARERLLDAAIGAVAVEPMLEAA